MPERHVCAKYLCPSEMHKYTNTVHGAPFWTQTTPKSSDCVNFTVYNRLSHAKVMRASSRGGRRERKWVRLIELDWNERDFSALKFRILILK